MTCNNRYEILGATEFDEILRDGREARSGDGLGSRVISL